MTKDTRLIKAAKKMKRFGGELPLVEDLSNAKGSIDVYGDQAYDEKFF